MKYTLKENDIDLEKFADASPEHSDDENAINIEVKAFPEQGQVAGGMDDKLEEPRHEIAKIHYHSLEGEGDTTVRVITVAVENADDVMQRGVRAETIVADKTTFEGGTLIQINSPDYSEAPLDAGTPVTPVGSPWSLISPVQ